MDRNKEFFLPDKGQKDGLLLSDEFVKSIPMYNPGLVLVLRLPDTKIVYVNNQVEQYLGYSNTSLAQEDIYFVNLLEPYQREFLLNQLSTVKDSTSARSKYMMYRLRSKNASVLSFYLYAAPFPDSEYGELYYILMHPNFSKWNVPFTSFDSKELFLEQLNHDSLGTFEWLIEAKKLYWSEGVYHIFEVDDSLLEITGRFSRTFIHPNDIARVEEQTRNAVRTLTDLDIEFRIVTAKQNIRIVHEIARVIKNSKGKPIKFAGSLKDITEQRHIEEDLKNKVEALYHSNRELEEFAYVASHDMQEPLRKITTFSDRLTEKYKDVLTGDGLMYLSRMMASAENMRSLINNLLEFSKISKTLQPFEKVNLNTVLRQVKTELELTIEETGTVINSQTLPTIDAISSQMKQLFANVLSNAIKFHKPDIAPIIDIKTSELSYKNKLKYELDPNAIFYKIEITDNGIGFDEQYSIRIFQVFQRLHGKSEYPGTGIGLAICKKILDYHGGLIYAENVVEKGARFIFILPQHQPKSQRI